MNVVYLIGNGLDLNLGLNTSYKDFYKFYELQESPTESVSELKQNIRTEIENWSDLEMALGVYTKKLLKKEDFFEVFDDIVNSLSKFIIKQDDASKFSNFNADSLLTGLASPEAYTTTRQKESILEKINSSKSIARNIDIITFNYTKTLEKIIDRKFPFPFSDKGGNRTFRSLTHVHGYASERMVLGVNDTTQIKNKSYSEDQEVQEAFIKDMSNFAMDHGVEDSCKLLIQNANLICIYGSSIGKTDSLWWKLIIDRLMHGRAVLLLFARTPEIPSNKQYMIAARIREQKELFLSKVRDDFSEEEKETIKDKIFVALNSPIFDLKFKPNSIKIEPNSSII